MHASTPSLTVNSDGRRRWLGGLACAAGLGLVFAAAPLPVWAASGLGVVTILDGEASLLRGESRLALAEGVRLQADDLIELDAKGRFLRLELDDGSSLGLGPDTRVQLLPKLAGERGKPAPLAYLLHGWLKLGVARKSEGKSESKNAGNTAGKTAALALASARLDLSGISRDAVLALLPGQSLLFVEAGELNLRALAPGPVAPPKQLKAGEFLSLSGADQRPELAAKPTPAFLQAVPRSFLDSLPSRAALFADKERAPKPLGEISYADAQPWLQAELSLRRANMPRWKPLARKPEFRKALQAQMKMHPEWEPVLNPPPPKTAAAAAPGPAASAAY